MRLSHSRWYNSHSREADFTSSLLLILLVYSYELEPETRPRWQQNATGCIALAQEDQMAKLSPRYSKYELETLLACIKPFECWTAPERRRWAQTQTGFRHFAATNITPIEHYWPKMKQQSSKEPFPNPVWRSSSLSDDLEMAAELARPLTGHSRLAIFKDEDIRPPRASDVSERAARFAPRRPPPKDQTDLKKVRSFLVSLQRQKGDLPNDFNSGEGN